MLLLLYWYCIYAFLANCCKGTCGYVQCWKSSVLSSFLNTEKVILGSFKLEGRQFQAAGPAWKNPRGPIVLVKVAGTNRSPDAAAQISGVIDQGAKRPVCSIETDTGVRSRVDTCKRRYRFWTRPCLGRGASVVRRAWRPKRWPTWVGQGQGRGKERRIELSKTISIIYYIYFY